MKTIGDYMETLVNKKVKVYYYMGDVANTFEGTLVFFDRYGVIVLKDENNKLQIFRNYVRLEEQ